MFLTVAHLHLAVLQVTTVFVDTRLENETPAETFPKFPSVLYVIDRSDRNPPITATSVIFRPSLRHASGL